VPDPAAVPPRVGYAIGRPIGTAVTRNRLRRRLRAVVHDEARLGLPPGWYLIGASPGADELPAADLRTAAGHVFEQVRAR
jgi:ribonuclease P protein component